MLRKISYISLFLLGSFCSVNAQDEIPSARELYDSAHYDQALVVLTEFLEKGANPDAYMLRGDCLQKLGDASMALNDYDKARVYGYKEDDLFLHQIGRAHV